MSERSSPGPDRTPAWSQAPPASERDTFVFSTYALRGGSADVQLAEGETVLGRSLDCGIVIDSPVVSRRHACIVVQGDSVTLRDLSSRNGIALNGVEVSGSAPMVPGDRLVIGGLEFVLLKRQAGLMERERASTIPPLVTDTSRPAVSATHVTSRASAFDLLRAVADKALALGSHDEVVRLLGKHIKLAHAAVLVDGRIEDEQVLAAATYAIRIAVVGKDVSWAVVALEMLEKRRAIPAPDVVDLLYSLVRPLKAHYPLVHSYTRELSAAREELSPTDRFALKRLEGLERLIALQAP